MKLKPNSATAVEGRTIFTKSVRDVMTGVKLLKPAKWNSKLSGGKFTQVVVGHWAGMPVYSLTLEERATCPRSCTFWRDCYGNNMPLAHRFQHGKKLELELFHELWDLHDRHQHGFVVRLHILGDFYSIRYVKRWCEWMELFPKLRVWGYTARLPGTKIGDEVLKVREKYPKRFVIRFSGGGEEPLSANRIDSDIGQKQLQEKHAVICPEQTGRIGTCLECTLCWASPKHILFIPH